jgi:hypothetical protein
MLYHQLDYEFISHSQKCSASSFTKVLQMMHNNYKTAMLAGKASDDINKEHCLSKKQTWRKHSSCTMLLFPSVSFTEQSRSQDQEQDIFWVPILLIRLKLNDAFGELWIPILPIPSPPLSAALECRWLPRSSSPSVFVGSSRSHSRLAVREDYTRWSRSARPSLRSRRCRHTRAAAVSVSDHRHLQPPAVIQKPKWLETWSQ